MSQPDDARSHPNIVASADPLTRSGRKFCSYRLVRKSQDVMEIVRTFRMNLFYAFLFFLGLLMLAAVYWAMMQGGNIVGMGIMTLLGLGFCAAPLVMVSGPSGKAKVFDRLDKVFRKGRTHGMGMDQRGVALANIAALQVLRYYQPGGRSSGGHSVYELNLVLKGPLAERIHLMAHGDKKHLQNDAQTLAQFLGVPLLDMVRPPAPPAAGTAAAGPAGGNRRRSWP